jgi:hypothetical protein
MLPQIPQVFPFCGAIGSEYDESKSVPGQDRLRESSSAELLQVIEKPGLVYPFNLRHEVCPINNLSTAVPLLLIDGVGITHRLAT